jgi:hypothetical protein
MKQETPIQKLIAELEQLKQMAKDEAAHNLEIEAMSLHRQSLGAIWAFDVAIKQATENLPYERKVIENAANYFEASTFLCDDNIGKKYFEQKFKTE